MASADTTLPSKNFLESFVAQFSNFNWEQFHFERPLWLLASIVAFLLIALLWRQKKHSADWHKHIDSNLLSHLLDGELVRAQKRLFIGLFITWLLASIAMAGPSWNKLPQPVHKTESARVILFDLSPSMQAEDLKPSRLIRARLKLIDLLQARDEGLNALIAYAGVAHVVTPLTDDTDTIISQLPSLSPDIMPMSGSNTEMAVEKALQLFSESGLSRGDILLVTDGIEDIALDNIRKQLKSTPFRLSILGVGTDEGAPIATGRGGFARDSMGAIVIAKLRSSELRTLAQDLDGRFSLLRTNNQDVTYLNGLTPYIDQKMRKIEREFDVWQDAGQWLVWLLLPAALFSFRRGFILPALMIIPLFPQTAKAFEWQDLWHTPDQQAQKILDNGDPKTAAEKFQDKHWKASAQYQAENFEAAAEIFSGNNDSESHYNRGNALAKAGKLEEAIEAYNEALALNPDFDDATFNKELVEKIKQQQDQNKDGENSENSDQENTDQDNSNQEKSDQDKQDSSEDGEQSNDPSDQDSKDGKPNSDKQDSNKDQQPPADSEQENKSDAQPDLSKEAEQEDSEQQPQQGEDEQQEKEQQDEQQAEKSEQQKNAEKEAQQQLEKAQLSPEEQAQQEQLEQWLRGIPDDPGGLLRNKFNYQHQMQQRDAMRGRDVKPENGAADRW